MKPYRIERLEKELLRIINTALFYKVNDPRLHQVTITEVKISVDLQYAKIYFSVLEDKVDVEEWTDVLTKTSGFLKKEIAATKIMRRIPEIRFTYDDTGDRVQEIEALFKKLNTGSTNKSEDQSDKPKEE